VGSSRRPSAPWHTRLEARLLFFVTVVTALSVAAMLAAANRVITSSAIERNRQDQEAAKAAFDRLIEQRQEFARSQSRLITELPVFRAHLSEPQIANDSATIEALAGQYQQSLASDFLLVADSHLTWLGRSGWPGAEAPTWKLLTHGASSDAHGHSALVPLSDGLYLVVLEPALFIDEVLGWVAAGYRLDDTFAKELARITHADVNLIADGRLWASSLDAAPRAAVASLVKSGGTGPAGWLQLGEHRYSAREYALAPGANTAGPSLLLVKDWQPTQALLDRVQARLLLIGLGAFVLAVGGTTVFCRRATRPLRDVVEAAHEITQGDWTRRVPVRGSSEAVAMAGAFNEMTSSLTALNTQLAVEKARAVDASRAKDQLLSNVSHELRTPLNGIMGMTMLALSTDLTGEQREYLDAVDANAAALLTMVDDVLDFARIDAGELLLQPAPFDLHQCLEACRRSVSPAASAKGLALSLEVEPAVPAAVVADESRLRQVALNLLGNAVKFTSSGAVSLHATLEPAAGDAVMLHVEVRDTGIGIPADKQEQIFQPFAQGDGSMTRQFGGTGLGLSIASRLVAAMGGRIWFESEPGVGSRFHFTATLDLA
jgi:signal transduction histidine kinase